MTTLLLSFPFRIDNGDVRLCGPSGAFSLIHSLFTE